MLKMSANVVFAELTFLVGCVQQFHLFLYFVQTSVVVAQQLAQESQLKVLGARMRTQLLWSLQERKRGRVQPN